MENRRQRRLEVVLNAKAESRGVRWDTRIRNFCQGGVLMEFRGAQGGAESGIRDPQAGEQINVVFSTGVANQVRRHRLAGKVAHVEAGSFGVQFAERNEAAWKGLLELHQRQKGSAAATAQVGVKRYSQDTAKQLIRQIAGEATARLSGEGDNVCRYAVELLMLAGERAREQEERTEFQRASVVMESQCGKVIEDWVKGVSEGLAGFCKKSQQSSPEESEADLSLVDQRSFDEWVAAVGLGARLQADFADALFALEQRFSALLGANVDHETNPIDPNAFVLAFVEAAEPFAFSLSTQRLLLSALEKNLRTILGDLYEAANQLLVDAGVLPVISRTPLVKPADASSPSRGNGESASSTGASGAVGGGEGGGSEGRRAATGMFGNLQSLFTPHKEKGGDEEEEGALVEKGAVIGALQNIGQQDGRPLKERVKEYLADSLEEGELPGEVEGAIDASENLVRAFSKDQKLQGGLGQLLGRLDAPLAKVALEQPDFLNDEGHPVASFMQDLERLALVMSSGAEGNIQAQQLKGAIEDTLGRLAQDERGGSEAFAAACDELAPYVERADRQYQSGVKRLADTREGEERLRKAHARVADEVNLLCGESPVPRLLVQLVTLGWENLLAITLLHKGPDHVHWKEYLGTFGALAHWLNADQAELPPIEEANAVIAMVSRGFSEVPSNPAKQERLVELVRKVLTEPKMFDHVRQERVEFRCEVPEKFRGAIESVDDEDKRRLASFAQTIRTIQVGDWLVERQETGISRPLSLVWKDAVGEQFSFVDGKGARALEAGLYSLANRLELGELSILEDGGLPLVQRAVQDVLQQTYETLLQNSENDGLTGLLNRRSFTKELRSLIEHAVADKSAHVMLLVDVDQFKLINDICGHEGGDQLLVDTANILKTYLGKDVVLSRVGDDEFGVLIKYCSAEDGFNLAETQRKALENYIFNWAGRRLTITVSIGMVTINGASLEATDDASTLMKDADTACYLAKKAGRNVVKVYESSDREVVEHQDEVQAATMVEDAIQQGRLQLYVQVISPVFFEDGLTEHYEVLLRVLDESNKAGSPEGLIKAAEGYGRMRIIDRWVIESVFNWVQRNHQKLDEVGGFSINLSGQSIDDENILELITQRVESSGYPPNQIAFEITETAMINDMERAKGFINRVRELGCHFYLDDFGSGRASYTYLKDLPVDCVKIDGSFVRNICHDENDYALVKSITETAHFMKKKVIAEFVTDEATLVRLRELEVDYVQGYELGKPFEMVRLIG